MSEFNKDDILTISAKSYPNGRRFTVVEANGHRTVLRGAKGAHRVLVVSEEVTQMKDGGLHRVEYTSIHEDDGEKNRGRPCNVDRIKRAEVMGFVVNGETFTANTGPAERPKCNPMPTRERQIHRECHDVARMLCEKNRAYGDSALDPVRIFSKANPAEGLRVRIDDKLSRIARGSDSGEDTLKDLIGYLVLLRISESEGMTAGEDG